MNYMKELLILYEKVVKPVKKDIFSQYFSSKSSDIDKIIFSKTEKEREELLKRLNELKEKNWKIESIEDFIFCKEYVGCYMWRLSKGKDVDIWMIDYYVSNEPNLFLVTKWTLMEKIAIEIDKDKIKKIWEEIKQTQKRIHGDTADFTVRKYKNI